MSIDQNNIQDVLDKDVHSTDGEKIGGIGQVYLDDATGEPEWVTVKTGLFGTKETFVPISQAEMTADGMVVPYSKDMVKGAPNVEVDGEHLSVEEEAELYRHYGLKNPDSSRVDDRPSGRQHADKQHADNMGEAAVVGSNGTSGRVTEDAAESGNASGRSTDDTMTLSEERLNVGTRTEETGRARLRKYVVTEEQTVTVPVRKEKLVVEREPITDASRDRGVTGAEISEEEVEIVLHEERPVVQKETVAVEEVRLGTQTVTDEKQVTETVRKEEVDTDGVDHGDEINPR